MKNTLNRSYIVLLLLLASTLTYAQSGWKAGIAKTVITPDENIWMAGFASRTKPASGKLHDLWAKALVLQDAKGHTTLLVTSDILGFPKDVSDYIRQQLERKHKLTKAQIILNSSHTHSGPVLNKALEDIYPITPEEQAKIDRYTKVLSDKILKLADEALKNLEPATIATANGVTRFQVNRRNNNAAQLTQLSELKGPNDYAVPVIKVTNSKGEVKGIVFGYACHPTVLNGYEWSGDYAGFAQLELEKLYPTATAMFFQGAAGDQNPLPRHSVALAKQYGLELAAAVERVLTEEMKEQKPSLASAYSEVALQFSTLPNAQELQKEAEQSGTEYIRRWAKRLGTLVKSNQKLPSSYPYPVQAWRIGDQTLINLAGEVTIEYAIKLKKIFGTEAFVMAYSNDVLGYIPSLTVLREGGYEGNTSQMVYGLPTVWEASIESTILDTAIKVGKQAGITLPK